MLKARRPARWLNGHSTDVSFVGKADMMRTCRNVAHAKIMALKQWGLD